MSNKELDNLFKNKLEKLHKKPSANAWDQIQSQTSRKKTPVIWWRIAAALLLLMVSSITIWQFLKSENNNQPQISKVEPKSQENSDTLQNTLIAEVQPSDSQTTEKEDIKQTTELSSGSSLNHLSEKTKIGKEQPTQKQNNENEENLAKDSTQPSTDNRNDMAVPPIENIESEKNIIATETPDATIEKQNASSRQKALEGTTLEFDLEDFKKTALTSNQNETKQPNTTQAEEKQSKKGLGKVLNIVKDLGKEAKIGELRDAKDELFAFNFKKDNKNDSE